MKITLGERIAQLRKEKNMTQLQLAEKMGVTDKAVSKWERNLSCPDISTIPKLAEVLEISVEELLEAKSAKAEEGEKPEQIVTTVLKAVPLAMGVAVTTLSIMGKIEPDSCMTMLGIGVACLALLQLRNNG